MKQGWVDVMMGVCAKKKLLRSELAKPLLEVFLERLVLFSLLETIFI